MNKKEMIEQWNNEIERLVTELNINEEELECFENKYDYLDEIEYMNVVGIIVLSYKYIEDISLMEREAFARGMLGYIDVCLELENKKELEEFYKESDEHKKLVTLSKMKRILKRIPDKDMYEIGIETAIKIHNLENENVRTRKK